MGQEAVEVLTSVGAVLKGHFRLTSGRHSDTYIEKFRLLESPRHTEALCRLIADRFRPEKIDLVAGPTTGGIVISYEVARQLGVHAVFAEKLEGGGRAFGRGFRIVPGQRVLVVDDVLTTGGSVREVLAAVTTMGANAMGVGVLVDRAGGSVDFGLPFFACLPLPVASYAPTACPQCAKGIPLTET